MAHPYIFESSFEAGSNAEWDSEGDTGSLLDFPHYSVLAKYPWASSAPYRGAYCARIQCGDTNDHTLTEGDIDIADGATRHFRFYINFMPNFTATADDTFNFLELQQAGGTVEASLGFRITAATGLIEIGIGDGTAPSTFSAEPIQRNRWYCIELSALIHTTDAGTLTLFVDGTQRVALDTLDNAAAVGQGVLGTQDTLATTTGTILFDDFVMDDARLHPHPNRFPDTVTLTKSGHLFVGPGWLASAAILTTTADNQVNIWDTDQANTNAQDSYKVELDIDTHTSLEGPIYFQRGCYVQLTGTAPRVQLSVVTHSDRPGVIGCAHYSQAGIRARGLRWAPKVIR